MTRARNVLAVILTPKAEESSEVLCCDTKNNWTLRCAQNDGDVECDWVLQPYWLQDDEDEKKKTNLSVGLLFCGCQDSSLEQYEDRTRLKRDGNVKARPLANTTG